MAAAPAEASSTCGRAAYAYAGVYQPHPGHGIAATLTALAAPQVAAGHVAGWVGVGGPNAGPNGEAAWIQVGYSGFQGGRSELYYEVTRPGAGTRYFEVDREVLVGETHRVAVAEVRGRPGRWRVWVDGRPASRAVRLPGSHGRWQPMAMGESWNGGTSACNAFSYRFARVRVAARPGVWRRLSERRKLEDPGYRVVSLERAFVSRAA